MDDSMYAEIREKLEKHEICLTEYGVRLMNVEETTREIRELTRSVQQIAEKQNYINEKIDDISTTVRELDNKPKENWNKLSWLVIATIATALISSIISAVINIMR